MRAVTGDAYLGHVFWDTEIYLLPFYTAVWPEAARAMYRYHTLPGARAKAAHFGFKGALVEERQSASPIVSSWSILFLRTIHELECSKRGQDVTTVVVNSLITGKVELSPHAIGVARLVFGYDFFGEIPYGVELGKIEVQTIAVHEETVLAHEGGHGHRRFADVEKQIIGIKWPILCLGNDADLIDKLTCGPLHVVGELIQRYHSHLGFLISENGQICAHAALMNGCRAAR